MEIQAVKGAVSTVYEEMTEQKDYLIQLDQQNGGGDLGLSMYEGFGILCEVFDVTKEMDLRRVFLMASKTFNRAVPPSLGAIFSFDMMEMAKRLKRKTKASQEEVMEAIQAGVDNIMEKAGSKVGEKIILDALVPTVEELRRRDGEMAADDIWAAVTAMAGQGSESTGQMKSVHGRAAHYVKKSIGILNDGSAVGKLIFEGIAGSVR